MGTETFPGTGRKANSGKLFQRQKNQYAVGGVSGSARPRYGSHNPLSSAKPKLGNNKTTEVHDSGQDVLHRTGVVDETLYHRRMGWYGVNPPPADEANPLAGPIATIIKHGYGFGHRRW